MVIQESSFVLSWQDITVTSTKNKRKLWKRNTEDKIILNKVCGEAKSGSLVAIMGPRYTFLSIYSSGAGKTTLLAALASKISRKTGIVTINNKVVTDTEMKSISEYLHQHFIVTESLTVKEHLNFMNALKLTEKREDRYATVNKLIFELNLDSCMNTPIRNLSGGEKKKLALAVEFLGDPLILYCDEPTTGLDSSSASAIVETLHDKACSGKLIITTIHQPSSQLYNYFEQSIFRMNLQFPKSYNPADFYIQHITKSNGNSVTLKQLEMYSKRFSENHVQHNTCLVNGLQSNLHVKVRKRHFFMELFWLIWRCYIDTKRNLGYHAAHFGLLVLTAFIISTTYSNIDENDENSVQNYKGLIFLITSELIFTHLYAVIYTFPEEYNVFIREESLYSSYAYFISKIVVVVPRCVVQPFIFLLIIFLQVEFSSGFLLLLKMFFVLFMGCMSATAFGLCIAAVFQSLEIIELFIMPLDLLSMLLAGILLKIETIPFYLQWIKYLSPFYYVYESLSILQWNNVTDIVCSNKTSLPCYKNGKEVLEDLGFHTSNSYILINILGMCVLSACFSLVGFLGILRKKKSLL